MPPPIMQAALAPSLPVPAVPKYLDQTYWWAYVHPKAVQVFERDWLVNTILFGNYARLRDAALAELGGAIHGHTLQVACVYGNLTPKIVGRLAPDAKLDVVDVLPVQLDNLSKKLPRDARVTLIQGDASALQMASKTYDQVLLFFLLHEMPEYVRRRTLSEAMRVLKPGGKLVIVEYHRPVKYHPLRPLMRLVFKHLEPFAMDLWRDPVEEFLPRRVAFETVSKRSWFGGLYEKLVLVKK